MNKKVHLIICLCLLISLFLLSTTVYAANNIDDEWKIKAGDINDIKEDDYIKLFDLDVNEDDNTGIDVIIVSDGEIDNEAIDVSDLTNSTIVGEIYAVDLENETLTIIDSKNDKYILSTSNVEIYFNGAKALDTDMVDIYTAVEEDDLTANIIATFETKEDPIKIEVSYATYVQQIEEEYRSGDFDIDGSELPIDIDDYDNELIDFENLYIEGDANLLEDIQENDIVTVYSSDLDIEDSYPEVVRLVVTRKAIDGKIVRQEDNDTFLIGDKYYDISEYKHISDCFREVELGYEAIFYLDENGEIFTFGCLERELNYGVIIGVEHGDFYTEFNEISIDDYAQIKIVTINGEKIVYDLYSKYDSANDNYEPFNSFESFELSGVTNANATYVSKDDWGNSCIAVDDSLANGTLFKYGINSDNQIDAIEIVDVKQYILQVNGSNLGNSYRFTEDTIIYDAGDDYAVVDLENIREDIDMDVIFAVDEDSMFGDIEAIIVPEFAVDYTTDGIYAMILDADAILNSYDDEVQELSLFIDGEEITYLTDDDNNVTYNQIDDFYYNLYELTMEDDVVTDVEYIVDDYCEYEVYGDEPNGDDVAIVQAVDAYSHVVRFCDRNYFIEDDVVVYVSEYDSYGDWTVRPGSLNDIDEEDFIKAYNLDADDDDDEGLDVIIVFTGDIDDYLESSMESYGALGQGEEWIVELMVTPNMLDNEDKDYQLSEVDLSQYMFETIEAHMIENEEGEDVIVSVSDRKINNGTDILIGKIDSMNQNEIVIEDTEDNIYTFSIDSYINIFFNGAEAEYTNLNDIYDAVENNGLTVDIKAVFEADEDGNYVENDGFIYNPIGIIISYATDVVQIEDEYDEGDLRIDGIKLPVKIDIYDDEVVDFDNLIIKGDANSLEEIQKDDIVVVYASDYNDDGYPQVVTLAVSKDKLEGKVTKKYDSNTFDVAGVKVDTTEYRCIAYIGNDIQLGDEGIFYLDDNGEIIVFDGITELENYAIIMGVENGDFSTNFNTTTIDNYAEVKLATAEGEELIFELYSDYDSNNDYEPFNSFESFELSGATIDDATYVYKEDGGYYYIAVDDSLRTGTLVKYGLNSDNQIDKLEIVDVTHENLEVSGSTLGNTYRFTEDTIIFDAGNDYAVVNLDDIVEDTMIDVILVEDEDSVFGDIEVIIVPAGAVYYADDGIYAMILDVDYALDSYDNEVQELSLLVDGEEVAYLTDDDCVVTDNQLDESYYNLYDLTMDDDVVTDVNDIVDGCIVEIYGGNPYGSEALRIEAIDTGERIIRFNNLNYSISDDVVVYISEYNTYYEEFEDVIAGDLNDIEVDSYIKAYNLDIDDDDDEGLDVIIVFTEKSEYNEITDISDLTNTIIVGEIYEVDFENETLTIEDDDDNLYMFGTSNVVISFNGADAVDTDIADIYCTVENDGLTAKIKAIFEEEGQPINIEVTYATEVMMIEDEYIEGDLDIDGIDLPVTLDEYDDEIVDLDNLIIEGDASSLEDIKEDDIVTVFASDVVTDEDHYPQKVKLIVTRDIIEGKVVKRHDSNTYTINDIKIDTSEYDRICNDFTYIELGDEGIFYLDENGEVLVYDGTVELENYGVIVGIEEGDFTTDFGKTTIDDYAQVKIVTDKGEEIVYDLYSEYDSNDYEPFQSFELYGMESGQATYLFEEYGCYCIAVNDSLTRGTLVKYGLNDNNQINQLEIMYVEDETLKVSGSNLGNRYRFTNDTIIFGETDEGYDIIELDNIVENIDLDVVFAQDYEGEFGDLEAIIIPEYGVNLYDTEYGVILDADNLINVDGDIVQELEILVNGEERTYITDCEYTVPSIQDKDFYFNLYEITLFDDIVVEVDDVIDSDKYNIIGDLPYGDEAITVQNISAEDKMIKANNVIYTVSDSVAVYIYENNKYDIIDISDLEAASSYYASKIGDANYDPEYDLNNDGVINIYDLVLMARQICQ